jgi:hypothetical protein
MTDTMTSQNIVLSSWDILYIYIYIYIYYILTEPTLMTQTEHSSVAALDVW